MTDDRTARATLTALAEPGEPVLNGILDRLGAPETLAAIRSGRLPDELKAGIADDSEVTRMSGRLAHWRIRLSAAEPASDLLVAERLGVRLTCPGDPEWPTTLDDLGSRRPYALWLRGPSDLRHGCLRSVALVGARAASSYGLRVASGMASELGERGWTVVSGGAMGIDAAAHRGSLAADGPTVAVLANGVDVPYPACNDGMFAELARRELLVSESPPGTTPRRQRFLVRNRVIAALSRGTVVVEAGRRSGALSTAHWARKLSRVVMAVPGPVTSASSVGCHALLRDPPPALLVTRSEEVIEAVGELGTDLAPIPASPVLSRDLLDQVAHTVLEALPSRTAAGPAQIAAKAGVDLPTANAKLGLLSAGGFVERAPGGWRLTRKAKSP